MSKPQQFGQAIAVQTAGPDAVEDRDEAIREVRLRLARYFSEQFIRSMTTLGYDLDGDTYDYFERQEDDKYVIGFTIEGRQTVPLWRRLWRAVRA